MLLFVLEELVVLAVDELLDVVDIVLVVEVVVCPVAGTLSKVMLVTWKTSLSASGTSNCKY